MKRPSITVQEISEKLPNLPVSSIAAVLQAIDECNSPKNELQRLKTLCIELGRQWHAAKMKKEFGPAWMLERAPNFQEAHVAWITRGGHSQSSEEFDVAEAKRKIKWLEEETKKFKK